MTHEENVELLCKAMLLLKTEEECSTFLDDLCSKAEKEEMARRFRVALLLKEGRLYNDIVAETGLSTATISRVSRCLKRDGGYKLLLKRLEEDCGE